MHLALCSETGDAVGCRGGAADVALVKFKARRRNDKTGLLIHSSVASGLWAKAKFRSAAWAGTDGERRESTMASVVAERITKLLKDHELFREACYIDGRWVAPAGGSTIAVDDPATGEIIGTVPKLGRTETREAIAAAAAAFPEWRARHGEGTRGRSAPLVRADHGQPGRSGPADDARTGQAARRIAHAKSLTARRSSNGSPRKAKRAYGDTIPSHARDKRIVVIKEADRGRRLHHAVELPHRDDHEEGRARARGRLHRRRQAGLADAVLGAGAGGARRARRHTEGGSECRHRVRRAEMGGELTSNPTVRKISFTGSTEVGKLLMAQCAVDRQESLARAGRQRAVHRVRRCGP